MAGSPLLIAGWRNWPLLPINTDFTGARDIISALWTACWPPWPSAQSAADTWACIHGVRACVHVCEQVCVRGRINACVSVNKLTPLSKGRRSHASRTKTELLQRDGRGVMHERARPSRRPHTGMIHGCSWRAGFPPLSASQTGTHRASSSSFCARMVSTVGSAYSGSVAGSTPSTLPATVTSSGVDGNISQYAARHRSCGCLRRRI